MKNRMCNQWNNWRAHGPELLLNNQLITDPTYKKNLLDRRINLRFFSAVDDISLYYIVSLDYTTIYLVFNQWEPWTSWSSCSLSCGVNGTRFRTRSCPPQVDPFWPDCYPSPPETETELCSGALCKKSN